MILRAFSSLLCASKVNESAKETEILIRLTPSAKWNSDLQRLNDTIKSNTIGLSGRRFFFVTKTFILAMIGTVVKYELVLLDEVNNFGGLPDVSIFKFSYKLPTLFREWIYFDYYVAHVNDVDNGKFKALNSVHILFIFMIMTLIEDILSYATDYESSSRCFHIYASSFEGFTRGIIPSFFKVFTYSHYWGAFFIITRFYRSIIWSFSNVFLVVIYYVIYNKVKKFNERIVAMECLIKLLQQYATYEKVAISTYDIIHITKPSILHLLGTIITYVMVIATFASHEKFDLTAQHCEY
ncbi:unnamed protein product [Chironomus riparius]|uniref:Gustatory receptor n=1 Tax=Chironomus riparius TaxID=315576 RepID=A0A9N9RVP4_9DIPT|nr:unnamed protein product [Chironomus riparius]